MKTLTSQKNIPQDWQVKKLSDICLSFKTGKLDANAMVENGQYRFYTCAKDYYFIDKYAFDTEALLVSGNGANVGYIHHYKGKFNAYQRTYVLDNFTTDIFFTKYLLDNFLAKRINDEKRSGNTPYITMDTLTDMFVAVPKSQIEQQKIATILTSVDNEIEKIDEVIKKTEEMKKGLMEKLFNPKNKPKDWEIKKIKDSRIKILDGDRGINYPKLEEFSKEGHCLFLNNKNIKQDKFLFEDIHFITEEKDKMLRKGKLERFDVVLTTRGTVGNVAFYDKNIKYENIRINSGMVLIRGGENFYPNFIYQLFKSDLMKKKYLDVTTGSAQPQLPINILENVLIPVPLLLEQKRIADILSSVDKKIESYKKLKEKMLELKKGLMSDLLSGRVRVKVD